MSATLNRSIEAWATCDPHFMATQQSTAAIKHAFADAKADIAMLARQRDELLAALCDFADWCDERNGDSECRALENARAAIAKVQGATKQPSGNICDV